MKPPPKMCLGSLAMLNRLAEARAAIQRKLCSIREREDQRSPVAIRPLAVTIDGEAQGDDIRELLKPVIERELLGQLAAIDKDIEALGVIVG